MPETIHPSAASRPDSHASLDTDLPEAASGLWPFCPLAFLHDAARFLALAQQQRLNLDGLGRLPAGDLVLLASELILAPGTTDLRNEGQAPGLSFLVGLLGQAGFLAASGGMLCLSPAAHDWLAMPAPIQLDRLRQVWWLAPEVNTRWFPSTRRQRPLDSHWHSLILHTSRWAASLPIENLSPVAGLHQYLSRQGAIGAVGTGRNLPQVRRAVRRQALALVQFLVAVVLPRLGLVEVQGEGDDLHLRPAPGGVRWLEVALERVDLLAEPLPDTAVELAVTADLPPLPSPASPAIAIGVDGAIPPAADPDHAPVHLSVRLQAPALCTFEISQFAELLSPGPPAGYRITLESLQQGEAWGYPVADVLFLLDRFSGGPVPQPAAARIDRWRQEMQVLACEAGYRLRALAPPLLAALRRREPFRRRTAPLANGRDAWVGRAEARDLFRYLRRVGYDLLLPQDPNDWPLRPPLRQPLPLSQLLVVLRTYRRLRRFVPGMALLELEELEKALTSSLPPSDLAAVERLVESHAIFLKHHLKRPGKQQSGESAGEAERPGPEGEGPEAESPESEVAAGSHLDDLEGQLKAAIKARTSLGITYADTKGHVTSRQIRPLFLETRWGRRYLVAFCELRQDERHFRLDRIADLKGPQDP